MAFELRAKDLLGRIGRIETKSGKFETPAFVPVINPLRQTVTASEMRQRFGCEVVITNAYILYRRLREDAVEKGVHGILSFDGVVMTDSGGYQMLEYGDVSVSPREIAQFQEDIGSDIAVPLDVPTGLVGLEDAKESVRRTLENVKETLKHMRNAIWVAPIQGGTHLELLRECTKKLLEMPFQMFTLGSPTPLMESYRFVELVSMISTVRMVLPPEKPLHLFGAGHPMLIPFAIALGCDTFDSASYYLYAKEDRYMTPYGTKRLESMEYLPCECEVCSKYDAEELRQMQKEERTRLLSIHNLYVCFRELKEVKQAILDGRLMELLEIKSRSHPRLYEAMMAILSDDGIIKLMEMHTPISKRRGMNLFDRYSIMRPEVRRARDMLMHYVPPRKRPTLVLIPYHAKRKKVLRRLMDIVQKNLKMEGYDVGLFLNPYGVIPLELSSVYPFSQTEYPQSLIANCKEDIAEVVANYVRSHGYEHVIMVRAKGRFLEPVVDHVIKTLEGLGIAVTAI